ncbi:MAG: hypothetical protein ABJA34_10695 [Pseudonocardiales bacterium]
MAVLGAVFAFMVLAGLAVMACAACWIVGAVREHLIWRDGGEPYIPSRVYIDERYGDTDADATRRTGLPSVPSVTAMRLRYRHPRLLDQSAFNSGGFRR